MADKLDYRNIHLESSLPKMWEQEESFNDVLYEWMSSAPWLAISAGAHLLLFLILWPFFGGETAPAKPPAFQASLEAPPERTFDEPPPELPPEEIETEEEPKEQPVVKEAEIADHNETVDDEEFEQSKGDPNFLSDSPFQSTGFNDLIGIGGGAGGKYGGRFGGKRNLKAGGGVGTGIEKALSEGLEWLKWHQSADGSWDCDGFTANCGHIQAGSTCDGQGEGLHDVGMTGLALLAFLGDGNTTREGTYKEVVARGIAWLKDQQDPESGLIGRRIGHQYMYSHAIATLAVCEAYYFSKSPLIKKVAQPAIDLITRARNEYAAWRYDMVPNGANDTSVTGWMVFALKSAEEAKLEVDPQAFIGALGWIDGVTDQANGRVGYDSMGSWSSRITHLNDQFPSDRTEAMTAVGLLCRIFMGQTPEKDPILAKHADLMLRRLPEWDPANKSSDFYYWYYGTYAMYQLGGQHYWEPWRKAMEKAVVSTQCKDGDKRGSWDPIDPWGFAGGRVYSTALMTLCLEVYFRYARVLGAR